MPESVRRHIYLVGFSGSGKSTLGRQLATRLGRRFVDTDALIERQIGLKIAEIFACDGERRFRKLETKAIAKVAASSGKLVVALGGGALERAENRMVIKRSGVSVYLECSQAMLYRRLAGQANRPLLHVRLHAHETAAKARRRRIKELLAKRRKNYLAADIRVSTTTGKIAEVVERIRQAVKETNT